jgi:hypothetical protein
MRDSRHHLGMIATPAQGNSLMLGVPWVADNGVFGGSYPGDDAYLDWLAHWPLWAAQSCRFAVAPDVVGDAAATLELSARRRCCPASASTASRWRWPHRTASKT